MCCFDQAYKPHAKGSLKNNFLCCHSERRRPESDLTTQESEESPLHGETPFDFTQDMLRWLRAVAKHSEWTRSELALSATKG